MIPAPNLEINVAKLEERLQNQKEGLDRLLQNLEHVSVNLANLTENTVRTSTSVDLLCTCVKSLEEKVETICTTVHFHIIENEKQLASEQKELLRLSVKQKILWGIGAFLASGALATMFSLASKFIGK